MVVWPDGTLLGSIGGGRRLMTAGQTGDAAEEEDMTCAAALRKCL